jgi:hypothetical protein
MSNIASDPTDLSWPKDEIARIAAADDLRISREDAKTYGTPTWIWSVAVDGALYVRAYNGKGSRWYQAASKQKSGRISAAGMTKDVVFAPVDGPLLDRIDEAYRLSTAIVVIWSRWSEPGPAPRRWK